MAYWKSKKRQRGNVWHVVKKLNSKVLEKSPFKAEELEVDFIQ